MGRSDPAEQALIRLELRRFQTRCDTQEGLLQRADTLREVARLARISIPYKIADTIEGRDIQRRVVVVAEDRARELIQAQIGNAMKVEAESRGTLKSKMAEDWANLTGVLGHLRTWAKNKLLVAEQSTGGIG